MGGEGGLHADRVGAEFGFWLERYFEKSTPVDDIDPALPILKNIP